MFNVYIVNMLEKLTVLSLVVCVKVINEYILLRETNSMKDSLPTTAVF